MQYTKVKLLNYKLILAISLLCVLVFYVGGNEIWKVFLNVQWQYIILLFLMSAVLIYASCLKWQLFIKNEGKKVSVLYLMKLYTISYFFNFFTPSNVGGDAMRSYKLGKFLDNQAHAFASTILERLTGMLAMCLLAIFALFFTDTGNYTLLIILISIPVFIVSLSCFLEKPRELVFGIAYKLCPKKLLSILSKLDEASKYASGNKKLFFLSIIYSVAFHFLAVINTYLACCALSWPEVSIVDLFLVLPLILIIGGLPLTPNGLGLQEGAFTFFLKSIGATSSLGLAVGLLLRAKVVLLAGLGGILYLSEKS